ncbi:hypothetical protein CSUB01_06942 [Colletotrichum sublineola]|uniref:LysM domain-containing protein n=1 Tax=Colletotrichum sublineola TaxID=1173701 RepID=A0A066XB13_COLSU|nr:hypothetical protein CSUB01_06942 [Colletotrichum sublineola]
MRTTSLLISFAAFAGMAAAKRGCAPDSNKPGFGFYRVVQGDDLNSIAADFDTTSAALAQSNSLQTADFIQQGQILEVPCTA